jgi:hypothetical protein
MRALIYRSIISSTGIAVNSSGGSDRSNKEKTGTEKGKKVCRTSKT